MMGRSCSLSGFLVLTFFFLSISHALGRVLMENSEENKAQFAIAATFEAEAAGGGKSNTREMMMVLDYDTGANVNTKGGPLPPPSQPAPAPLLA